MWDEDDLAEALDPWSKTLIQSRSIDVNRRIRAMLTETQNSQPQASFTVGPVFGKTKRDFA